MVRQSLIFSAFILFVIHLEAKDYNVISYGAKPNGISSSTPYIQAAIDQAHQDGGGRVVFPKGRYVSGSIHLKSNVKLYLENKATLLGSLNAEDYTKSGKWKALILAKGSSNIGIGGKGTINGRGAQLALKIDSMFYAGMIDSADYNFVEKRPKYYLRPQIIYFFGCNTVDIRNITIENSACWVQTYEQCKNLQINGVKVDSDAYWNNDGIDIVDSKNVLISDCHINSSDDGICIKSEDFSLKHFCDSILIRNCSVRSSASAVKFGTSSVNHIRNVTVQNIKVFNTYRSAIAIEAMQGGILENILVENIVAKNTGNAIFMRIGRIRNASKPGLLKNITLRNIKVTVPFENPDMEYKIRGPELPFFHNIFPSSITGIPNQKIENVTLENITIAYPGRGVQAYASMPLHRVADVPELVTKYPEFSMFGELPAWGFFVRHVDGLIMTNIKLKIKKADYRTSLVFDDVNRLTINNLSVKGDKKKRSYFLRRVTNFSLVE